MALLNTVYVFFDRIDKKRFYQYTALLLITLFLIMSALFFQFYRTVHYYKKKILFINELRDEARIIREKAQHVQDQRTAVDTMLAEDPDFKIGGYFNDLLTKLSLTDKKSSEELTQIDRDDNYRESELTAQLVAITMKQLTELLYEIEQKKRIYIKKLIIEKSKKADHSIEVLVTLATLLPKPE